MQNVFKQNFFCEHHNARDDETSNDPYRAVNDETKNSVSHRRSNRGKFINTIMPCVVSKNGSPLFQSVTF
jgi:hypothetical protein